MIKYNNLTINDWNFDDSNIKKVYYNNDVCYQKITNETPTPPPTPIDYTKEYLTFEPISSAVTFAYKRQTTYYSLDSGSTWNELLKTNTVTVGVGEKIMWKATLDSSRDDGRADRFVSSGGTWKAYGNLLSLQDGDNFTATTTIKGDTLHYVFYRCADLVDIDNLKITATSGGHNTLRSTFRGCGMTTVPEDLLLSITSIGSQGYMGTFEECSNLTNSPILPISSIPSYGYFAMFNNCTNLSTCTCLATSGIGYNETNLMLNGVASSGTFYKHPNASWTRGQYGVPSNWTIQDYTP